jgi:translation initiation factor IF-3
VRQATTRTWPGAILASASVSAAPETALGFSGRSTTISLTTWPHSCAPWRLLIPPLDKRSAKSFIRTNERIRAREVRVIDENGEQLGVMAPFEALKMAREKSLDLVEISPNATPPVCKIQDYGKYLYEKDKSDRAARKKQKVIVIKEVKFSVTVDEHDYQTKKNQAVRFLGEGDKVKASLRFKGRQMAHRDLGYKIINRLIMDIGEAGVVEFMPRMEGTTLHAILAPSKKAEVQQPPAAPKVAKPEVPAAPVAAPSAS